MFIFCIRTPDISVLTLVNLVVIVFPTVLKHDYIPFIARFYSMKRGSAYAFVRYMFIKLRFPHKRGKIVLVTSPDCRKTNVFKTNIGYRFIVIPWTSICPVG